MRRRHLVGLAVCVILAGAACTASAASGGVTELDAAGANACAAVRSLVQAGGANQTPTKLRSTAAQIYQYAQTSSNPLIRARAVAFFTDATSAALGGEVAGALRSDVTGLQRACTEAGA